MADCIIGVPTFGEVSIHWAMSLTSIAMPINFTNQFHIVLGKRIDEARNEVCEVLLKDKSSPRFLFFLDDDVIMPPDSLRKLIHRMENLPEDVGAISGVYYSKSEPGEPLIFKERGKGSYYDWRVGDFFKTWAAGCGLVLIRAEALRRTREQQGEPLFKVDYGLHRRKKDGVLEARSITEDLYFYTKMRKTESPNGKKYSLWIDTSIQAKHYDKGSKKFFGLSAEEPQAQGRKPIRVKDKLSMAWIGYGGRKDHFDGINVTTVDSEKELNPDVVAFGNHLPFDNEIFDLVYSAYLLHTFKDTGKVLCEWLRILKPSGKIHVKVPNIDFAFTQTKKNPSLALEILYQGKKGFNEDLAKVSFKKAGFVDIYTFIVNEGKELNILGRKGEK